MKKTFAVMFNCASKKKYFTKKEEHIVSSLVENCSCLILSTKIGRVVRMTNDIDVFSAVSRKGTVSVVSAVRLSLFLSLFASFSSLSLIR